MSEPTPLPECECRIAMDGSAEIGFAASIEKCVLCAAAPQMFQQLQAAANLITAGFCSHHQSVTPCGPHNDRCYAQGVYRAIYAAVGVKGK